MRTARIELHPAKVHQWWIDADLPAPPPSAPSKQPHYLRLVAANGQVLATSETYSTRQNARRAVGAWIQAFCEAADAYPADTPHVVEFDAAGERVTR